MNDPRARTAAAAGGCVVVRSDALVRAGGIAALRGEVIDDCALGRAVKRGGPIWLGLAEREASVRLYQRLGDVWNMVARSAYTQLRHSALPAGRDRCGARPALPGPGRSLCWPGRCTGTRERRARGRRLGAAGGVSSLPTLALYRRSPWLSLALPAAGALYAAMTFDSGLPPLARARRDLEGPRRRRRELGAR